MDGSPIKRRRLVPDVESPTRGRGKDARDAGNRMMSALDVLAEQAAVVISQSPERPPSHDSESEVESEDETLEVTPRQRPQRPDVDELGEDS